MAWTWEIWACIEQAYKRGSHVNYIKILIRKNGAMDFPDGGTHKGIYDAVILEKRERSRAVRSYAEVTRGDVKTPLGENRLIISSIIYFIKVYLH